MLLPEHSVLPSSFKISGIGSAVDLRQVGIDAVVDLPEVGQGLTDHTSFFQHWRLRDPSAGYTLGSPNPLFAQPQYSEGVPMDWTVSTTVPKEGLAEAIKKDEGTEPDAATHPFLSKTCTFLENMVLYAKVPFAGVQFDAEHMTTAIVSFLPTSRGSVSLRSSNPEDQPKSKYNCISKCLAEILKKLIIFIVSFNFLSTEVDKYVFRQGLRQLTQFMLGPKFGQFIEGESVPAVLGLDPVTLDDSDEKLDTRLASANSTT